MRQLALVCLLLLLGCSTSYRAASTSPWRQLAEADAVSVCENIKGVHPAMVDPQTPEFAGNVEKLALRRAPTRLRRKAILTGVRRWGP